MKILYQTTISLLLLSISFLGGWFTHLKTQSPEIRIETKEEIVWRDKIVYRDYQDITREECIDKLRCYDTAEPTLDIEPLRDNTFRLSASLCERKPWTRDVKLSVGESGNWKFYVGAGIVAGAGIAYLIFK